MNEEDGFKDVEEMVNEKRGFFDKLKGAFRSESKPEIAPAGHNEALPDCDPNEEQGEHVPEDDGSDSFGNLGDEDEAIAKLKSSSRVWRRAKADRLLIALKKLTKDTASQLAIVNYVRVELIARKK